MQFSQDQNVGKRGFVYHCAAAVPAAVVQVKIRGIYG